VAREIVDSPNSPSGLVEAAHSILETDSVSTKQLLDLQAHLDMAIVAQSAAEAKTDTWSQGEAQKIKANPLFTDPKETKSANWIKKSFERLSKIKIEGDSSSPKMNLNLPRLDFLAYVVWIILGSAVVFLLFLAFRHFSWKRSLTRKAAAMLEDDEPVRTVDEWLELADSLVKENKYREAVRCLYLACLLRFDEKAIARFDRSQTNWEHYNRIQVSDKLPQGLKFGPPTQSFDHIWYGNKKASISDVTQFKSWYEDIVARLKEVSA
jgi:hypothetical protein